MMHQCTEDELIQISALSQVCYCERRYALIYLEQAWEENRFTAEGEVLHERVHTEHHESRGSFKQEYAMAVRSLEWGLIGKCDLVELWFENNEIQKVSPVEFKRGREKENDVDRVQLCAQALCLEEMFRIAVEQGQIYYWKEHRRKDVSLDADMRKKTTAMITHIRQIVESGKTPQAAYSKRKCDNCSVVDICMPKSIGSGGKSVASYLETQLRWVEKTCDIGEVL
jgi:CRISPR-associated exonuclease Cas4